MQGQNYVDLLRIPTLTADELERLVDMEGWHHLEMALAAGHGAIFAALHLGNVDLAVQAVCARGVHVTIPVETIEPPALFDYVTNLRTAHGLQLVPIGPSTFRVLLKALREGGVAGIVVDRDVHGTGRPTPFLGRAARLSHAPALLSLRARAPIVPASVIRLGNGRFRARIHPPIWPPERGRGADAVEAMMREVVIPLETAVRQTPGQWVMFQRLFPTPEDQ
jgi:KDO2-lipid IV(A) lauroyltransferase